MTTINEVAKQAQVSVTTVSHVINNTRFVSPDVQARVRKAMTKLDYRPNALARSLRRGHTDTIGLILPDSGNPFFAEIGHYVESAAFDAGYNVILCNTEGHLDKEKIYVDVLIKKQVDGIIFIAAGDRPDSLNPLLKQRLPVVLVDRNLPEIQTDLDSVITDNYKGGFQATKCLIDAGHKRIACITGPYHLSPSADRTIGYRDALKENGLIQDDEIVLRGDFHAESGYSAALKIFSQKNRPTAIVVFNDLMAIGVLRAAWKMGLQVPSQLAVVGFDNIDLAQFTIPTLTTIEQPKREIASVAVKMLIERIHDNSLPSRTISLQTKLVIRESCGTKR